MNTKSLLATFLLLSSLCSCKHDEGTVQPTPQASIDFPLGVGSVWTYAIYDSVSLSHDTVQVKILSATNTSTDAQSVWQLRYIQHTDTVLVVHLFDTLRFNNFSVSPNGQVLPLVYPLQVGNHWSTEYSTILVASIDTVSSPGGVFSNSVRVEQHSYHVGNDYSFTDYWIEPKVGIVQIYRFASVTVGLNPQARTTWT